jgi:uncharacterized protein (TIGR02466 family)
MAICAYFPTLVYTAALQRSGAREFNRQLRKECRQLRADDAAGRRWSAENYPGGYTSYGSVHKLQRISPTFKALERKLARHVGALVHALDWDVRGRELAMTDCWVNIMARGSVHVLHLHPLSALSGTYYVDAPRGCPGIKFEDPRLDRFMAAPPRKAAARPANQTWISVPAASGRLVLFESWLRHEVSPNLARGERVSVSFNYNWF